jgi:hypothetical protein
MRDSARLRFNATQKQKGNQPLADCLFNIPYAVRVTSSSSQLPEKKHQLAERYESVNANIQIL